MIRFSKNQYILDIIAATSILLLPLMLYVHLLFENKILEFNLFGIIISSTNTDLLIWHFLLRCIPILLFIIWFLTSSYTWRYLIFIPIFLYTDSLVRELLMPLLFVDYTNFTALITSVTINLIIALLILFSFEFTRVYTYSPLALRLFKYLSNNPRSLYSSIVTIIDKVKEYKKIIPENEYLYNLANVNIYVEKQIESYTYDYKSKLSSSTLFVIFVSFLLMPLLFNLHEWIPEKLKSFSYGPMVLSDFGFKSIDILVWLLFLKVTYLLSLSIWFITSLNWWKYAILSPIVLVSYQIWEMFQDVRYIDAWGNLRAFPFILFIILTLIILSNYVKYELKVSDLQESISRELDEMIGSKAGMKQMDRLKEQLNMLRAISGNKGGAARKKLDALIKMREDLLRDSEINC